MRRLLLILGFLLCCLWTATGWTQAIYVYPQDVYAPSGSYQTCTAVVVGTNDKTVTWSKSAGTFYGSNPGTANEPNTIALNATTVGTYLVTATSNANGSVSATCTIHITPSPTPTTGHPRLYVTSAMLAGLQAKAVSTNPIYQNYLNETNTYYYTPDSSIWTFSTWNGSACTGGSGPTSDQTWAGRENDANLFAWFSMIGPNSTFRNEYGCAARDIWVYVMTNIISGAQSPNGNDWSDASTSYTLTGDWLMAGGYLSASDLILQRQYNAFMLKTILPYGYGLVPPVPSVANYNSSATFNPGGGSYGDMYNQRTMGNNYTMSKMEYLAALSLTFDDNTTDDPPLTGAYNTCGATRYQMCSDYTAGSLHAYWNYFAGVMLYLDWAHLEVPNVTWQAYQSTYANLPTKPMCESSLVNTSASAVPCFGDGRGGESSEGAWYQESLVKLRYALNIMYTAGYNDPILYGPQVSLGTSSWWDEKYVSDLSFLTSFSGTNGPQGLGGVAPLYTFFTTGDNYTYWRNLSDWGTEASTMVFDSYTGRTDRSNALKWGVMNSAYGGADGSQGGCSFYCGFDAVVGNTNLSGSVPTDAFIAWPATDPQLSLPTDPRPAFPTDLFNGSFNQHVMVRNGWTQGSNTVMSYACSNAIINHELENCGDFDILSNGEYITKKRVQTNDYNANMSTSIMANQMSILNTTAYTPATPAWGNQYYPIINGGQYSGNVQAASPPLLLHSELPAYSAAIFDETNLENGSPIYDGILNRDVFSYNSVTSATRSLVYLRGSNQVVFYDRGITASGLPKSTNQITTGAPTLFGSTASWLTRSATQKAYLTNLLPAGVTVSVAPLMDYVVLSGTYANLHNGDTQQMTCTLTNADGSTVDVTTVVSVSGQPGVGWSSSNTAVATISSTGLVTSVGLGSTVIRCLYYPLGFNPTSGGYVTVVSGASSGTFTSSSDLDQTQDWEIYSSVKAAASGTPTAAQFLNVMEWGASSLTKSTTSLVSSSAGQTFQGARVGTSLVMFSQASPLDFTGTTFPAFDGDTVYVSDLTPNTSYPVSGGGQTSVTTDTAGVLSFSDDLSGDITVGTSPPQAAAPTLSPPSGAVTSGTVITLSSVTGGATICSTVDGSTPTADGAGTCTHGATGTTVTVSSPETIKAIASKSGDLDSTVSSAAYTITSGGSGGSVKSGTVVTSGNVTQ
jgi:hypothetical protein